MRRNASSSASASRGSRIPAVAHARILATVRLSATFARSANTRAMLVMGLMPWCFTSKATSLVPRASTIADRRNPRGGRWSIDPSGQPALDTGGSARDRQRLAERARELGRPCDPPVVEHDGRLAERDRFPIPGPGGEPLAPLGDRPSPEPVRGDHAGAASWDPRLLETTGHPLRQLREVRIDGVRVRGVVSERVVPGRSRGPARAGPGSRARASPTDTAKSRAPRSRSRSGGR